MADTLHRGQEIVNEVIADEALHQRVNDRAQEEGIPIEHAADSDSLIVTQADFDTMRTSVALMLLEMDNLRVKLNNRMDIVRVAVEIVNAEERVLRDVKKLAKLVGVEL